MQSKIIIIGAGIAGLALSVRLAVKGHAVAVYEANSYAGGKLSNLESSGFRFDAGPSLFTMPQYIEELFQLANKPIEEYFSYRRLEKICNYFWEDGTRFQADADIKIFAKDLAANTSDDASSIIDFFSKSKSLYDITHKVFLEKSLHKLGDHLGSKSSFKALFQLNQIDALISMHKKNSKRFSDKKTIQLFDRYATYNGSNPYQAPATLNIIPHLEHGFGAFFPEGGMHSITKAIHKLAVELGVDFKFNSRVSKIIVEAGKATGIECESFKCESNYVVSNADIFPSYHKLLPNQKKPEKTLNQEQSSSALIFYWGIKGTFPELDLHNILFSQNYKEEFDEIFKHQTISNDPTVYINISSKINPSDALANCENWFTMINVPNNSGQDWEHLIAQARENIIAKINRILKIDLKQLILSEEILDPLKIEEKTSSNRGALYGSSSNNKMAAFLRHPNFSSKIKNLYFCGGSVHPGGGIPLCLLSAKIVSNLID